MPTVVVRHKVGDFETWLAGHEDRVQIFASAVAGFETFQDVDDPNSIVLVMEVTDMEQLETIMNDPDVQDIKDRHTVIDPIVLSMQVSV
jgi:quinol monooxygenase YgiN